jgi:hypothetical protein
MQANTYFISGKAEIKDATESFMETFGGMRGLGKI